MGSAQSRESARAQRQARRRRPFSMAERLEPALRRSPEERPVWVRPRTRCRRGKRRWVHLARGSVARCGSSSTKARFARGLSSSSASAKGPLSDEHGREARRRQCEHDGERRSRQHPLELGERGRRAPSSAPGAGSARASGHSPRARGKTPPVPRPAASRRKRRCGRRAAPPSAPRPHHRPRSRLPRQDRRSP